MAKMTLEEALEAATVDEELVAPVNEIILINPETRIINMPDSEKLFGVIQDGNVERKHFKCPKIVGDNVDLSKHQLFINYVPSKSDGTYDSEENVQSYFCEDVEVSGDYIKFSWKLSENVMRIAGYVAFAICAKSVDENGNLRTKWHTNIAIGKVLDTLPDGNEIAEIYPDLLVQLLDRMDAMENGETLHNVLYAKQELTEEQQTQARTNIGAAAASEVSKLSEDIATKVSAIKEKASGEVIVATDSDEGKLLGLAIDGKSEQNQYSGNQLYNIDDKRGSWSDINVDKDGWITVESDNTNGSSERFISPNLNVSNLIEAGKEYLIVAEVKEISVSNFNPCSNSTSTNIGQFTKSFTVSDVGTHIQKIIARDDFSDCESMLRTTIRFDAGVKGKVVFRMSVLKDTSVTADTFVYEPFVGGKPSPSNEYQQEIRNIGVYDEASGKYAVEVKCTRKNLIDVDNPFLEKTLYSEAGVASVNNNYNVYRLKMKKGDTVVVKATLPETLMSLRELFFDLDMNFKTKILSQVGIGERKSEYTATEDGYLIICNRITNINLTVYYSHIANDTNEEYEETTTTVLLDEPLRKGDKAYWNGGSKVRVDRNTISRKPIVSKVTEISDLGGNPAYRLSCNLTQLAKTEDILSNCFIRANNWSKVNGISISATFDRLYIVLSKEEMTDASVETARNWINSHDVVCEYQIAEPITEEIDIDLGELSMFYPTTILSNDCNANMEVTYIADTKAYIDKLKATHEADISALKTAIVALGGTV